MEVIPGINCHLGDFECVESKVRDAERFAKWVHLDVADGLFTFNKTWGDPVAWKSFQSPLHLEVHLMVEEPEAVAEKWLQAGAKRLIVHAEAVSETSFKNILKLARSDSVRVMLALNPETHIKDLPAYLKNLAEYQILAVHPGLPGQRFLPLVLNKISELRREVRSAHIEVDGGMNPETVKLAKERGADAVVSASYIFSSSQREHAFRKLHLA